MTDGRTGPIARGVMECIRCQWCSTKGASNWTLHVGFPYRLSTMVRQDVAEINDQRVKSPVSYPLPRFLFGPERGL